MKHGTKVLASVVLAAALAVSPGLTASATSLAYYTGAKSCTTTAAPKYYQSGSTKSDSLWAQGKTVAPFTYTQRYYSNVAFVYRFVNFGLTGKMDGSIAVEYSSYIKSGYGSSCDN